MEVPQIIVSQYQITKLLGQGQFGKVFRAVDINTGNIVALKEIEYHKFPTHKFLREVHFLVSLQHPNIVTCQGIKHTKFARYIVMDYCEGGNLREWLDAQEKLSLEQALEVTSNILSGLEYAHSKGIVHCDLKPENILLSQDNLRQKSMISDFGIARLIHDEKTELMGVTGSPAYMAPERYYGKYSPTSDLYAVGVMLFEMIVGDRPFSGLPGKLMVAHLNQPVEVPSTVPFLIKKIITKALQKLPQKRFPSATEMLESIALAAKLEKSAISVSDELPLRAIDLDTLF
ncbi:serine/threonine-protein kinase [Merismopedia glauca]|uniref:Serine/threonine protein kinase n=2 Tax=Merismopedia TaxID=53402 RepID=A0A2T1BXJ4_9CYAN|nr:serine/threonine-protein kinase [Merismopedia glauca]PSB00730.1 serine/threonine protein kinase [Merismopedia glauca CCAP 1448/3]